MMTTVTENDRLVALRRKYREERDKRLRPEGEQQYFAVTGELERFVKTDPRARHFQRAPLQSSDEVVIVGGGWSGLLAAGRLSEAGVKDVRILDDAGDFGGAWYWNQYPGAQCDIDSYCYLPLLEETGYMPEQKYSNAPEIQEYARLIGKHYNLYDRAIFHTRVTEMRWNEASQRWNLKTNHGDQITSRFVILGSGPTSRAKLPGIPGIDEFQGHTFHTSRWDYDYTGGDYYGKLSKLKDKRVAIIGTGCTAIQCIPHLAASAQHLYVFQRTPSAVDFRRNCATDPEWFKNQKPGWQRDRRENFDDVINFRPFTNDLVSDGWTDMYVKMRRGQYPMGEIPHDVEPPVLAHALELADVHKMDEIRARVEQTVRNTAVAEQLKAWYARMCKRPAFNDEYLDTFNRPNVTLIDTSPSLGVERLTKTGIVANGVEHEVDCIIFSTGFEQSSSYRRRLGVEVYGRGGESLYEHWRQGMRTLHGHSVHGFPNWFFIGLSQVGLTFNFCAVVDPLAQQVAYIISECQRRGVDVVEATGEGEQAWLEEVRAHALKDLSFQEACTPGYYNNEGRVRETTATFWGDFYMGGLNKFVAVLKAWKREGILRGMEQRRAVSSEIA
jgi:cyclohexanone monooxygenase